MLAQSIQKIFGSKYERDLKKIRPLVDAVNQLGPEMGSLTDAQLRAKTDEFREQLAQDATLDDLLPEAFAAVREASCRTLGMRHFDVQVVGGISLHQGKIAEMKTGEGKTLAATLAATLNALEGKGVHIVTVNDYLARRDRDWMSPIFEFMGLTVGVIQHDMDNEDRRAAYDCDITYGTNNEFGFDYLRDNLKIDPDSVESERGAVSSERRLHIDDDNFGKLYEQMRATAYVAHPYQGPIIGWPSDIENWTQEDLEAFYKTYYAPNNLTMVFTGDVTPEEIYILANQYLSPIPRQHTPPEITTVEPQQLGARRVVVETDAQAPLLHMAFHAGATTDADTLHLDLLLAVLAEGNSSRLHRLLVEEEQLALQVSGWQSDGFDPGLAYFAMTLPPGADVEAAEARLLAELRRVAADGVTAAEITKARNLRLASFWRGLQTIDGKASAIGNFAVFTGDYENLFAIPERLTATTRDDLKAVAEKVFRTQNMTVGILRTPVDGGDL